VRWHHEHGIHIRDDLKNAEHRVRLTRPRRPRPFPDGPIDAPWFYCLGITGLNDTRKAILWTVWTCYVRKAPCQPALATWAAWLGRSRSTVCLAMLDLERRGWLRNETRWGRKSNLYFPGWRLLRLIERTRRVLP